MEIIEEPLTKQQRDELEGIVAISTQVFRAITFIIFVIVIGAFFRWLQDLIWTGFPIWIAPTVAISIWVYLKSNRWTGGKKLRSKIRDDLADGKVVISVLEPKSIEEVEELEDEGPSYIIQTDDDGLYLLTGQEMAIYKSRNFPWARFGVVETPHAKRFLGLRQLGNPLQNVRRESQPLPGMLGSLEIRRRPRTPKPTLAKEGERQQWRAEDS